MGLGRDAGEAQMTDSLYDDQNRISAEGSVVVPAARLDAVISGAGRYALLKVDVEGLEWDVLRGAEGLLERVDGIYLEVSERHFANYGYTVGELMAWLETRGFAGGGGVQASAARAGHRPVGGAFPLPTKAG